MKNIFPRDVLISADGMSLSWFRTLNKICLRYKLQKIGNDPSITTHKWHKMKNEYIKVLILFYLSINISNHKRTNRPVVSSLQHELPKRM